ncbi:MlaD family protein [Dongia deserti]|uniref:MlaD family protein n=1 Tax=Dongia deserti TaxID=2268030 RepID=UPI000E65BA79|nr:MlaD family protein [Dongia deserti]
MIRIRHTDEWIGLVVIGAIAVLVAAILQAGVLRDWFKPSEQLRLVLPESGVAGLAPGGDVEVLGTKAGIVRRVVLEPNQQMYAILEIDEQATPFIRRDSTAVIRRRFGLAGAAFVDISRGSGPEMDWSYAVIEATTERAPTDNISALINELREKIFPILDNAGRATNALAEIVERINRGEGNVGRVLVDDALMVEAEKIIKDANLSVARLNQILVQVDSIAKQVDQAAERSPNITKSVEQSVKGLPAVLAQLQITLQEIDKLSASLRSSWLVGGRREQTPAQQPKTFSPSQVVP